MLPVLLYIAVGPSLFADSKDRRKERKELDEMNDPVAESNVQKGIIPDAKPVDEAPRRADGVSQLCTYRHSPLNPQV